MSPNPGKLLTAFTFGVFAFFKKKVGKKIHDEFLRNLLSLPIPANYWRPLLFLGGFAFFKKKVGKKFMTSFCGICFVSRCRQNYWRPLFPRYLPRYSLFIKMATALWLSQASGFLFFAWKAPLFFIILKALFQGPTYGGSLCIGFICGFYHLGKRHLAKENRCRGRY